MIKTRQICGDIKPLAEFSKDRAKKDGHSNRCKACDRKKNRKWRQDNPSVWLIYKKFNHNFKIVIILYKPAFLK